MAWKLLEFERLQAKTKGPDGKRLRPTLPCDMGKPQPRKINTSAFKPILVALETHGPMTSRDLARLLKKNSHNICGTIRQAIAAGLIEQTPHAIEREDANGHMDCWLYHLAA